MAFSPRIAFKIQEESLSFLFKKWEKQMKAYRIFHEVIEHDLVGDVEN
jgi:hypothetical protein